MNKLKHIALSTALIIVSGACSNDAKDAEMEAMRAELSQLRTATEQANRVAEHAATAVGAQPAPTVVERSRENSAAEETARPSANASPTTVQPAVGAIATSAAVEATPNAVSGSDKRNVTAAAAASSTTAAELAAGALQASADELLAQAVRAQPVNVAVARPIENAAAAHAPVAAPPPPNLPQGTVRVGQGSVIGGTGEIDASQIAATIKARITSLRACYETALSAAPTLAAKVVVEFTVEPGGAVTSMRVADGTDAALAACVTRTMGAMRMGAGPVGGSVTYSYPLTFSPQ